MKTEHHVPIPVALAAAIPACLATLAVIMFTVLEMSGHTLSSDGRPQNLAEAAAIGSISEVVRFLQAGEDPNKVVAVRAFAISSSVRRATALEAAVWHRSAELMRLLDRTGAVGDGESRRMLTCLAADLRVDEIVAYFSPSGAPACAHNEGINRVLERSREP